MRRAIRWMLVNTAWFLLLLIGHPIDAVACSCMESGPPCQAAFQVDFIFAGTVQRLTPLPDDGPPLQPGEARLPSAIRAAFTDIESFRGIDASSVDVLTAGSSASCGYAFKQGERYLVYATRNARGEIVVSICSRTRRFETAVEDLQFLRALPKAQASAASVFGTINHWESNLATGISRDYGPVPDVPVIAKNAERFVETRTDASGRYQLRVPAGRYEVSVLAGPDFSTRFLQQVIEIPDPRACAAVDFSLHFAGRISGTLNGHSGEAVEGASVELMAVERIGTSGYIDSRRASSGADGAFDFIDVPPGRYVVGVDLTPRMDPRVVYPTTYHPGTSDAKAATIVQVDAGEAHPLPPLTLPAARRSYQLTGVVLFEDGRPAAGAFISLQDGESTWRQVAVGVKPQSDGTFSFVVHEGLSYVAHASLWDEAQRKQREGITAPFLVSGDTGPLKVVISPR